MALKNTEVKVPSLKINKVPTIDIYNKMVQQNLINDNELYLVQDEKKLSINPEAKTDNQTQNVGVDSNGKLWTAPRAFIITCTKDVNNPDLWYPNNTFDELIQAYNTNRSIELICGKFTYQLFAMSNTIACFSQLNTTQFPTLAVKFANWQKSTNQIQVQSETIVHEDLLKQYLNRNTQVKMGDTNYTTYMVRGEALFNSETTPTVNGTIAWQYE